MIEYRSLTKQDLPQWQKKYNLLPQDPPVSSVGIPRTGIQSGVVSAEINCIQNVHDDAICAIVATDDGRLIGKLIILYTDLLIDGHLQRCAIGSSFYVLDEYRDRAVGIAIMLKALNLGVPYLEAGVSGQMLKILNSWKQFNRVDESLEYQAALNKAGLVQITKWDLYTQKTEKSFLPAYYAKVNALLRNLSHILRFHLHHFSRLKEIPVEQINESFMESFFSAAKFPIQIPWNKTLLLEALSGTDPNYKAWFVSDAQTGLGPWLMTVYRRERNLGKNLDGSYKKLREAYLNEVYPPLIHGDPVEALLSFACKQAKSMDSDILRICAMTPAMDESCRKLGLVSRTSKSVFVAPGKEVDEATKSYLCDSGSWWCRAFSEDQFEESLKGDNNVLKGSLLC